MSHESPPLTLISFPHCLHFLLQSTLINLLQGKLTPQVGYIRVNPQLRVGIFTQHHMDSFDLSLSPIQNMALRWPLVNEVRVVQSLAFLSFTAIFPETKSVYLFCFHFLCRRSSGPTWGATRLPATTR